MTNKRTSIRGLTRRRRLVRASQLRRSGIDPSAADAIRAGDWLISHQHLTQLRDKLRDLIRDHDLAHPLEPGMPVPAVARSLGLPSPELVRPLIGPPLHLTAGWVSADAHPPLPSAVLKALDRLSAGLREHPFAAPDANQLCTLGLDRKALAAAESRGHILRVDDSIVLLPGADRDAAQRLTRIPQPFTPSQAGQCLDTTRRVTLPLLQHLDRLGHTYRLPDGRRQSFSTPDPSTELDSPAARATAITSALDDG